MYKKCAKEKKKKTQMLHFEHQKWVYLLDLTAEQLKNVNVKEYLKCMHKRKREGKQNEKQN